jgi:hypothetical protein
MIPTAWLVGVILPNAIARDCSLMPSWALECNPARNRRVNNMINEYRVDQMTDEQLCRYYDNHPNLTLAQLAEITGRSLQALKALLLGQTK